MQIIILELYLVIIYTKFACDYTQIYCRDFGYVTIVKPYPGFSRYSNSNSHNYSYSDSNCYTKRNRLPGSFKTMPRTLNLSDVWKANSTRPNFMLNTLGGSKFRPKEITNLKVLCG